MKRVLLAVAVAVVLAGVIIGAVVGISSATTTSQAQKDCRAELAWSQKRTGQLDKGGAALVYNHCMHDPNRSPASFWQKLVLGDHPGVDR